MKICIIGGGNVGTAMAVMAMRCANAQVVVLTSAPEKWQREISMLDLVTGETAKGRPADITSDYERAVNGCDMVLIAQPSYMAAETLSRVNQHLKSPAVIGIIPGTGGAEFHAQELVRNGHVLFGVDRVPCIARVTEYGKHVAASPKKTVRLCAIPMGETGRVCSLFTRVFGVKCIPVKNYLTVTLTPSNPLLHTARLFALASKNPQLIWEKQPLFYGDWDDASSELLLACDDELKKLCAMLSPIPLEVVPLTTHYEVETVSEMTGKMRSLPALRDILSPMVYSNGKYALDLSSRYFTEDFPYGLCVVKGISSACGHHTPNMDRILHWYESIAGVKYFEGGLFTGADLKFTGIPQNHGIKTADDICRFYMDTIR